MSLGRLPGGSVLEQLRARRTNAGPAAGAIVAWLLDEADAGRLAAAALTTGSIARATGCARATVVRFVRDLGFPNFAAFQLALAVELAEAAPPIPRGRTPWPASCTSAKPGSRRPIVGSIGRR
ncbi:MAG TPA: hypothetical protein VFK80_03160 [Limnochordia bacterium]|nr:hypothetical protein [Limnochordia bacterium]